MKKVVYFVAAILLFAMMPISCTKEYDNLDDRGGPVQKSPVRFGVTAGPDNGLHKSSSLGPLKAAQTFGDGDTVRVLPGYMNLFFISNPLAGCTYTWTITSPTTGTTVYTGTEVAIKFTTIENLTVSISVTGPGAPTVPMVAKIFVTNSLTLPIEQIRSYTSVRNGDFSWTYTIVGSTHTLDTTAAGSYFSTGDQTGWANLYTAIYVPGTVTFSITTYNNKFKVQYGKGTIYSDATGSKYHSQVVVDNVYQFAFDNGALYDYTHTINTTAPGTRGDVGVNAAIRTAIIGTDLNIFCNVTLINGLKTNSYLRYRAIGTTTWTTLPLVYVDGNGYGVAVIALTAVPSGPFEFQYGADGGTATVTTSLYWDVARGMFVLNLAGV